MNLSYVLCALMACCMPIRATEYLYPVGHTWHDGFKLLLLYQKSVHHVELWQWDPVTLEAGKALLSSYTPAGIATLPDNAGFSFIDNDTIRVAYAHKRSPLLIPLYEPLYDFTTVQWLDQKHCIASAKEKERYGIYSINVEGQCTELLSDKQSDYRYPNIIENNLFYIHAQGAHHTIMQGSIDRATITQERSVTADDIFNGASERAYCLVDNQHIILDCKDRHVAFLTMVNAYNGFYLEHPACIDRHATTITFSYHQISKQGDTWNDAALFEFSLPLAYLMDPHERLFESILPFLPKLIDEYVYYCDCPQGAMASQLWRYDMHTHEAQQITEAGQSVMGIYHTHNTLWHGGVLQQDTVVNTTLPVAWEHAQGAFCVRMPTCYTYMC